MIRRTFQRLLLSVSGVFNNATLAELKWFRALKRHCYFFYKSFYERELIEFTRQNLVLLRGGHVVDVGANIGFTMKLFAPHVGRNFKVWGFEPEAENYKLLRESTQGVSNARTLPLALGERDSHQKLWINPRNFADHRIVAAPVGAHQDRTAEVHVRRFDSFWEEEGDASPIAFIKMDIQGYELFALKGMRECLRRHRPTLLMECDPKLLAQNGTSVRELYDFLSAFGYEAHEIDRKGGLQRVAKGNFEGLFPKNRYKDVVFVVPTQLRRRPLADEISLNRDSKESVLQEDSNDRPSPA